MEMEKKKEKDRKQIRKKIKDLY